MTMLKRLKTGVLFTTARYVEKPAVPVLLIIGLTLLIYANTISAPFVFDDEPSIVRNEVIRDIGNFFGNASGYRYNQHR